MKRCLPNVLLYLKASRGGCDSIRSLSCGGRDCVLVSRTEVALNVEVIKDAAVEDEFEEKAFAFWLVILLTA